MTFISIYYILSNLNVYMRNNNILLLYYKYRGFAFLILWYINYRSFGVINQGNIMFYIILKIRCEMFYIIMYCNCSIFSSTSEVRVVYFHS